LNKFKELRILEIDEYKYLEEEIRKIALSFLDRDEKKGMFELGLFLQHITSTIFYLEQLEFKEN